MSTHDADMGHQLSISVALCTRNGATYLAEQLQSILSQTYPVTEIIVSDDASEDATRDLVMAALGGASGPRFTLLENESPLGVTANFEQAIRATSGDIVVLCDQDDVWHSNRVATAADAFAADPDLLLQFSNARLVDDSGRQRPQTLFDALEITDDTGAALQTGHAFDTFLRRNLATGATMSFRRGLLDVALPFPAEWVHDEWLAMLAAVDERIAMSMDQAIDYRQHGKNEIGVVAPTIRGKISRVLQSRGDRNRGLAERSRVLLDRLTEIGADENVIERAREKLRIEQFRATLPDSRVRRIIPVLRRAGSGDYRRYCSQGTMDVVRDLLQPA